MNSDFWEENREILVFGFLIFFTILVFLFCIFNKPNIIYAYTKNNISIGNVEYKILDLIQVVENDKKDDWAVYKNDIKIGFINKNELLYRGSPEYIKLKKEQEERIKKEQEEKERIAKEEAKKQELARVQKEKEEKIKTQKMLDNVAILSQRFGYSQYGEKAIVGKIKNNNSFSVEVRIDIDIKNSSGGVVNAAYTYDTMPPKSIWKFEAPIFGPSGSNFTSNLTIDKVDDNSYLTDITNHAQNTYGWNCNKVTNIASPIQTNGKELKYAHLMSDLKGYYNIVTCSSGEKLRVYPRNNTYPIITNINGGFE